MDALLEHDVSELSATNRELRNIAHVLRLAQLDDRPRAAPSSHAALPVPVHLNVSPHPLPDDLAITSYYVACETMTNAAQPPRADRRSCHACRRPGRLRVEDDGWGDAVRGHARGLAGLADRVSALGGSLRLAELTRSRDRAGEPPPPGPRQS